MARRKRAFLEDDSDSSEGSQEDDLDEQGYEDNDPDVRAERNLFENPYQRSKRRRVGGKDDALYGIFGEDDEDEGFGGRKSKPEKHLHFTQAPSFVTGDKKPNLEEAIDLEDKERKEGEQDNRQIREEVGERNSAGGSKADEEEIGERDSVDDSDGDSGEDDGEENVDEELEEEESRGAGPALESRMPTESEEEAPRMGIRGLGATARQFTSANIPSRGGIGSKRSGLGVSSTEPWQKGIEPSKTQFTSSIPLHGGMGSRKTSFDTFTDAAPLPSTFGAASQRPQRSFLRDGTGSSVSSVPGTAKLSQEEKLHFSKLQGSFGAKLMAKMGWQAGTGLGATGEGIVTPVETKLRPKASMGLAFKGFREKTAQSRAEARRRGEILSEDEDEAARRKHGAKRKGAQKPPSDAWKKPKTKMKVEHQTYEQIVQNAGQEFQTAGIGKIYDATSGEMREVSSLADIASASWTPSTDTMRIPEVRHNLRLIVDVAKGDLDGLAREARTLEDRKKRIRAEDERLRQQIQQEAELIARLQSVHLIVDELKAISSQSPGGDHESSLDAFSPHIEKLMTEYEKEYDLHRLDEIVVGAIAPIVRQSLASWRPLQNPTLLVNIFRRWGRALKISAVVKKPGQDMEIYGSRGSKAKSSEQDLAMTPYESLMWNAWLPKVRSCINNDWSPLDPNPAIQLYEAWSSILPPFIRDNMLDQLILPKVQHAIIEWQPRPGELSLQTIVFPWLPHVDLRIEELLGDAKRKVKSLLRSHVISNGIPEDLVAWKDVFGGSDWNAMMLKYIVPKLGVTLREDLKINPRQQDMKPIEHVLPWHDFLRPSVFSQLLETEFFTKWLNVLHIWLIQPSASFEEVAQWYAFWKGTFPQDVLELSGVTHGFTRGLQLMNKAIELGPDAASKLPRPDLSIPVTAPNGSHHGSPNARSTPARAMEITFRSIVEEFAATHDLLFIPTGRSHEKSRMPLFRVSQSIDGKGGALVYILDDAVWASDGDDYRAISLDEMVLRANRTR